MKKVVYFVFNKNPMCFLHVLLNGLEFHKQGWTAKIVLEGEAVTLIQQMEEDKNPLYVKVRELGIFDCICRACSIKMGVLEYNEKSGIPLKGELNGHPSMEVYLEEGYQIITL